MDAIVQPQAHPAGSRNADLAEGLPGRYFSFFPQFCSDPLNDAAWGSGFTDWDLIRELPSTRRSRFTPARGYYDPTNPDYVKSLAQAIQRLGRIGDGLMLYHYFFDGHQALPGFEEALLRHAPGFPFFVCWANESWTKRWQGRPNEFIVRQEHRLDKEIIKRHVRHLARLFELVDYLRIDNRPLLLIYEPLAVVHMTALLIHYRAAFSALGFNPLIGACLSHPLSGLEVTGFDFVAEFEPRYFFNLKRNPLTRNFGITLKRLAPLAFDRLAGVKERLKLGRPAGRKFLYSDYLETLASGCLEDSLRVSAGSLPLMRSGFLHWDNTPRYRNRAVKVTVDLSSADSLQALSTVASDAGYPLLVNSWNEWSEGAAFEEGLEGDQFHKAFLNRFGCMADNGTKP